jgi:hypothetical protein
MNVTIPIVSFLALTIILASSCRNTEYTSSEKQNNLLEKERNLVLARTIGDALDDKILLTEIKEGRISNAIDILDFSIDCSIVQIANSTNYDAASQQEISQTLKLLKEFRQRYPRNLDVNVGEGGESKTDTNITKEADEILERAGP